MNDILRELAEPRSSDTYRRATLLARGGMAVVERVYDARLRRDVARKLLPLDARRRDLSATERRRLRRFLDEALVQSHLQHPAILPVHDLGVDERGWPFFTMPIVQGKHFGEVIAAVHARTDATYTRERALQMLVQVGEAMSYAHGKGVVHRDLKPENLMVGASGEVLVMDFGLAQVRQPTSAAAARSTEFETLRQQLADDGTDAQLLTLEGDVVGTPAYMAPEQAAGDLGSVDQLSDQYALGAVLYQLLTGVRPYGDGTTSTARQLVAAVRQKPPTAVHLLDRSVPAELCAICERAMQRDPSARYAEVAELTADLRAFLEQRVVRAHQTGWRAHLRTWLRRNRGPAVASLAAVLTLVVGVVAVLWVQNAQQQELLASAAALRTEQATAQQRFEELRQHAYVSDIGLAQRMRAQGRGRADVRAVLDRCEPSLRGWDWHYLAAVEDLSVHTFRHAGPIQSLTLSEDGGVLGSSSDDGFVRLWDTASGTLRREISVGGKIGALALSTDLGRVALGASDFTVRLHDTATGAQLGQSAKLGAWQTTACFTPDGKLLVTAGSDKQAHVWRVPGFEPVRSHPIGDGSPHVLVHPDGDRVIVSAGNPDRAGNTVAIYDLATGAAVSGPKSFPTQGAWHLALDVRGTKLRAPGRTGLLELDLATGTHTLSPLPDESAGAGRLLGDGPRLVLSEHGYLRILDATSPATSPGWQGHEAAISRMTADRAGRWLFTGDIAGVIKQWDLAAIEDPSRGPSVERTVSVNGGVNDIALAPDGDALAVACGDGKLRVWRLDRDAPARVVDVDARELRTVTYLPVPGRRPQIVVGGASAALRFYDSKDLTLVGTQVFGGAWGSVRMRASQDGCWLVPAPRMGWANLCVLSAVELRDGTRFIHTVPVAAVATDLAIGPDGKRVATADFDGRLRVYELAGWRKLLDVEIDTYPLRSIAWSPNGKELAIGSENRIHLVDADTGTRRTVLVGHGGWVQGLRWSRDGARLFSLGGYGDDQLKVWDPHMATERVSLRLPDSWFTTIDLSADNRVLAVGHGAYIRIWRLP